MVRNIAFCGGDVVFSVGNSFEIARLSDTGVDSYFEANLRKWQPDAIILFGDERPIHRAAARAAKTLGIPVWCFEEGYIRPNHVTFELGGNNANSSLSTTFDLTLELTEAPVAPRLSGQTFAMIRAAFVYFVSYRTTRRFFPGYSHHRERRLRDEFFFWWRTLGRRILAARHDAALVEDLCAGRRSPFFLVALQIHDDLQLTRHGRGWRTMSFVEMVFESFRRAAPKDCRLVVKAHPLDVGYGNNKRNIRLTIARYGLEDRVDFLQSGPLAPIAQKSLGLVTINSTAGLAALRNHVPVAAFGDALYLGVGLAQRPDGPEGLDAFWNAPPPVDPVAADRFVAHVMAKALVPGSFYLPKTWPGIAAHVERRLTEAFAARHEGGDETRPLSADVGEPDEPQA